MVPDKTCSSASIKRLVTMVSTVWVCLGLELKHTTLSHEWHQQYMRTILGATMQTARLVHHFARHKYIPTNAQRNFSSFPVRISRHPVDAASCRDGDTPRSSQLCRHIRDKS
ncbi:hypothetical protein EV702DRAFT_192150 [Suillus placidus]|uniref:Uncharacterized protein n=1 Tax=Suillus placidus TaxID=48579 RepID=A0A9P6ZXW2_9AGAM|nr:hypothetical protein EV702DRAFT_192150 [Suillus placidus]